MRCPTCGNNVSESPDSFSCNCVTVKKLIHGKKITPEIVHELLANRRTLVMDGFVSDRNGKPFKASLVIIRGAVSFEFEDRRDHGKEPSSGGTVSIRVQSDNPGSAYISIRGAVNKDFNVSYGRVSSRMTECLGTITAVNYVKHHLKTISCVTLDISLNNLDFSRYILRERSPRDRDMKLALDICRVPLSVSRFGKQPLNRRKGPG